MARTVFITGNDGSGKSTFLRSYESRLRSFGINTVQRHYYDSSLRSLFRGIIGFFLGVARQKNATHPTRPKPARTANVTSNKHNLRSSVKQAAVLTFLWLYQFLMGLETRWRDITGLNRVIIMDRSYVDDLVSIVEIFDIQVPTTLVKWSSWLFPVRTIFYLSAGCEEEFSRIVEVDLSREVHHRKHECYKQIIEVIESAGVSVHHVDTSSRK